jgi:hypothetical protein
MMAGGLRSSFEIEILDLLQKIKRDLQSIADQPLPMGTSSVSKQFLETAPEIPRQDTLVSMAVALEKTDAGK